MQPKMKTFTMAYALATARDKAVDAWLKNEVASAYDAIVADPQRGLTAENVQAALAAEHKKIR